jgi:hypothetical protein
MYGLKIRRDRSGLARFAPRGWIFLKLDGLVAWLKITPKSKRGLLGPDE